MNEIFLLILSLVVPILIGYLLISIIARRSSIRALERFALSFLIGSGLFSFSMFILGMVRLPIGTVNILIPWVVISFALAIIASKDRLVVFDLKGFVDTIGGLLTLRWYETVFLLLISARVCYSFIESLIKPVWGCDSFTTWSMRAKIFYFESGLSINGFKGYLLGSGHTDYPINTSLLETWIAKVLGKWDDLLIKAIFPIFFLCLLVIFYYSLRRLLPRFQSLVGTYLLTALPLLVLHSTAEYADLPVTVYYISALLFFIRYAKDQEKGDFIIFSLLSALAAWTKFEGLMLIFVSFILLLVFMLHNKRTLKANIRDIAAYSAFIASLSLPWYIFKSIVGVPSVMPLPQISNMFKYLPRIPIIINYLISRDFLYGQWEIAWFVLIVVLISSFARKKSIENVYSLIALSSSITLFFLIYFLTGFYSYLLDGTAGHRNTMIYMPIIIYYISINLPLNMGGKNG